MDKLDSIAMPLVSIVCATFNHSKFIGSALDGFLMQETNFPIEIVVHDDASTDGTTEIICGYKEKYPKIIKHVVQKKNQYSLGRRIIELAIPFAEGRYIAMCEGDDYWADPMKLQKQVDFLENNPDYVITYHRSQPFNADGDLDVDYGGAVKDLSAQELRRAHPLFTLTTCFRNVVKIFPPEFSTARLGDLFLWSMLGQFGKGKYLPDIGAARYRVHSAGVHSMKIRREKVVNEIVTYSALLSYYNRIGEPELAAYFKKRLFIPLVASYSRSELMEVMKISVKKVMNIIESK